MLFDTRYFWAYVSSITIYEVFKLITIPTQTQTPARIGEMTLTPQTKQRITKASSI